MNDLNDYDHNGNYKGSSWYPNESGIDAEYERQCAIDEWEHRPLSEKISGNIWLLKERIIDLLFNTEFHINLTIGKKPIEPF